MNEALLRVLVARMFHEVTSAQSALLVALGIRLGLYATLATQPRTSAELSAATGTDPRLLNEWLRHQAASGLVSRDRDRYFLGPEQAVVFGEGPVSMSSSFSMMAALASGLPALEQAFRRAPAAMPAQVDESVDQASRRRSPEPLLALLPDRCRELLEQGANVAELGSGAGDLLLHLAGRFPRSRFTGYEPDWRRYELSRHRIEAGVATGSMQVLNRSAARLEGSFDLIITIDSLHEMEEFEAVALAVAGALSAGGAWIVVEPALDTSPAEAGQADVVERYLRSLSALYCRPAAPDSLGAAAAESAYEQLFLRAGLASRRLGRLGSTTAWEVRPSESTAGPWVERPDLGLH
ncbi:MAG: class I SAM-dependent methyltransferase [Acidobacteriota bacterium]